MPVPSPIDDRNPSSPAYQIASAVAVAAGASAFATPVCCVGYDQAAVLVSMDAAHTVQLQASLDETTWFTYVPHGDTVAPTIYSVGAAFSTVRRVELCGVRFLRVVVGNTSGGGAVLNAWVTLGSRA